MRVFVDDIRPPRFDDGTPVTSASGIAPVGDGWLIAQDTRSRVWRCAGSAAAVHLLAVVDDDDPGTPSSEIDLRVVLA